MSRSQNDEARESVSIPLFGTWRKAYLVVVAAFVVDIGVFYGISRYFG